MSQGSDQGLRASEERRSKTSAHRPTMIRVRSGSQSVGGTAFRDIGPETDNDCGPRVAEVLKESAVRQFIGVGQNVVDSDREVKRSQWHTATRRDRCLKLRQVLEAERFVDKDFCWFSTEAEVLFWVVCLCL